MNIKALYSSSRSALLAVSLFALLCGSIFLGASLRQTSLGDRQHGSGLSRVTSAEPGVSGHPVPASGGRRSNSSNRQRRVKNPLLELLQPTRTDGDFPSEQLAGNSDLVSGEENEPKAEEEFEGDGEQRYEWFMYQRAYPFDKIPGEARSAAARSFRESTSKNGGSVIDAATETWNSIGPNRTQANISQLGFTSGRITSIVVSPADDQLILVGAASGGIWRSTNGGQSFNPVSDNQVDLAVGSIAFAPSNPNIVYAGMGDSAVTSLGNYMGSGVLRSVNGGQTWTKVSHSTGNYSIPEPGQTMEVAVSSTNPDWVYLVLYGSTNISNGLTSAGGFYVSTNGGQDWVLTFPGRVRDLAISPDDPTLMYLAVDLTLLGASGVYRSSDGGTNWSSSPIYTSPYICTQDIRVSIAPHDAQKMYVYSGGTNCVSKSTTVQLAASSDAGTTWVARGATGIDPDQFFHNVFLSVWPDNSSVVFVGGKDVFRSLSGGVDTWTNLTNNFDANFVYSPQSGKAHPDQHCIAFSPTDANVMYVGNDGGLYKSLDAGNSFQSLNNGLAITQFVGYALHPTDVFTSYGGTQDNGTQYRGTVDGLNVWKEFSNGDGGRVVIDPLDTDRIYNTYVRDAIYRYRASTGNRDSSTNDAVFGEPSLCTPAPNSVCTARVAFYPPLVGNRTDSTLYFGTWRLFINSNPGQCFSNAACWTAVSGDLTKGSDDVLSAIAMRRAAQGSSQVIYTGSRDGQVMVSTNGGGTFAAAMTGLPNRSITGITVAASDPTGATAYLTVSGYGSGHLFKTTQFGNPWVDIGGDPALAGTIPNIPANALLVDPLDANKLYLGTDVGVFRSAVGGGVGNWSRFNNGMPPVVVTAFDGQPTGKIHAATYGRGAYELNAVDCTIHLSSLETAFSSVGGSWSVQQDGLAGCAWTASSNASWLTITSGSSGSGPGTINFNIAANPGLYREGTISVNGGPQTLYFTVKQEPSPCANTFSLSPATASWNELGGINSFNVAASNGNCPWTATTTSSWLHITAGASGTGVGMVSYSVDPNQAGTGPRTGSITVDNRTFTVTEDGPTTFTWTGGTFFDADQFNDTTSWFASGNWSPRGVPGAKDFVIKSTTDVVDLQSAVITVARLTFTSGQIINGTLSVAGPSSWSGSSALQNVTLNVTQAGTLTLAGGAKQLNSGGISNRGTIIWQAGPVLCASAFFDNFGTFRVDTASDGNNIFQYLGGQATNFNNEFGATFRKVSGSGTVNFTDSGGNVPFKNRGTLDSISGVLRFPAELNMFSASSITGSDGGSVLASGPLNVLGAATITSGGDFTFSGSQLQASPGGTLDGEGSGTFRWKSGIISGPLVVNARFRIEADTNKFITGANVTTGGEVTWLGAGNIYCSASSFTNNGTFTARNDASFVYNGGAGSGLINNGTFIKTASTGVTTIGTDNPAMYFNNRNVVNVESGTLALSSGTNLGTFNLSTGTFLDFISGLSLFENGNIVTGAGHARVKGGTLGGTVNFTNTLELISGTLQGTITPAATATLSWTGGTLNTGTLTIPSGARLTVGGAGSKVLTSSTINNAGLAEWSGGSIYITTGAINNTGIFSSLSDGSPFVYNGGQTTTITNQGTISKASGSGTTNFGSNISLVNNGGVIDTQSGTQSFSFNVALNSANITGLGLMLIDTGTTTLSGDINVTGNFQLDGSTFSGAANARIISSGANTRWTGGTLSGTLTIPIGSQFNLSSTATHHPSLNSATINNAGTIEWAGTSVDCASSAINNTGIFQAIADGAIFNYAGAQATTVTNRGTLIKLAGTGTTSFTSNIDLINDGGIVQTQSGTFAFTSVTTLKAGSVIAGNGRMLVTGTINLSGNTTVAGNSFESPATFEMSAGTLAADPAASIFGTNNGGFEWSGGSINGTLNVGATGRLHITGAASKSLSNLTLNNLGRIRWYEGDINVASAIINNKPGAEFIAASTGQLAYAGGSNSTFNNEGTLKVGTTIGRFRMAGNFANTATGQVFIELSGTAPDAYDRIEVSGGTTTIAGNLNVGVSTGFVPAIGTLFPIILHGAHSGTFANVNVTNGQGRSYTAQYNATNVTLQTVAGAQPASTTTSVSSSTNLADVGVAVTFTAAIVSPGAGTPSGTVTFRDGASGTGVALGPPVAVLNGAASITSSSLSVGSHTITADYSGDSNFNASSGALAGGQSILPLVVSKTIGFGSSSYTVSEGAGGVNINVTRTGDASSTAAVNYATGDSAGSNGCSLTNTGWASSRCDYETTVGTLTFAVGETSRTITIPVVDDSYAEGNETFSVTLGNPIGAVLAAPNSVNVTITDNESANGANSIDQASFFVRLHYLDFLNREPDVSGLGFWSNQITECGTDAACVDIRRTNVSAAFFLSIEFQETGYLVYRFYKAGYGNISGLPVPVRLNEFLPDTQQIGRGVVVGAGNWQAQLEANKQSYALDFVTRQRFINAYASSMTPTQFVDALFLAAGVTPTPADRAAAISEFGAAATSADSTARARSLRRIAENSTLNTQEYNKAFVLMQYFGYLRRNPNDAPDTDFSGFSYWLNKLNEFNGNYINAEMVRAFITAAEYRGRFGVN